MPAPTTTPVLKDITTNKLYPAYKTPKGKTIQMNGTKTVLPTGATLSAMVDFVDGCNLNTVIISGGNEAAGHSAGSFHGINKAIDVAGKKFNKLTDDEALKAAKAAGFTHGVYEDFRGTKKDHWHFQIGSGNGLGDKHSLKLSKLAIKRY